jgi:MFS family permease
VRDILPPPIPEDSHRPAKQGDGYLGIQFWLLCLSSFLFFGSFNMLIPELPNYLTSLGGEDYKGLIIALFTLTAGLSRPFSGKLADTIGRVPVMVFGVIVCIITGLLYPILTSVAGFLFLRFMHGMSTGFKPTAISAFVADITPFQRRGEAMGMMGLFSSLGMASGPAIGSLIALHFSMETLFYCSSATALLSILVVAGIKETLPNPQPFRLQLLKVSRQEIIEPAVIFPSIIMLLSVYSFGAVVTITPDLSQHLGIENKGLFFTFFTAASIAVRVFAGKASDRFGRVPIVIISLVLLSLAMLTMGLATNKGIFFLSAILFGAGVGMGNPTLFAWTIDLSKEHARGKAMATLYIALEAGIGTGAILSSLIYHNDPAMFQYAFWSGGVLCVAALLLMVYFRSKKTMKLVA